MVGSQSTLRLLAIPGRNLVRIGKGAPWATIGTHGDEGNVPELEPTQGRSAAERGAGCNGLRVDFGCRLIPVLAVDQVSGLEARCGKDHVTGGAVLGSHDVGPGAQDRLESTAIGSANSIRVGMRSASDFVVRSTTKDASPS